MGAARIARVAELFAGVGGFRLGLERANAEVAPVEFKVVWSNQWEPSTRKQHASDVYQRRFGSENHSNEDIRLVRSEKIPDHDVLVAGFPCQDFSVARARNQALGLVGKKGVLWWEIHRILEAKGKSRPRYLILENVDRLLKSPTDQRGREFAIVLSSLLNLGYVVEWRVINAADFGMPQRRRRVFIVAYHERSGVAQAARSVSASDWIHVTGTFARAFPVGDPSGDPKAPIELSDDLLEITTNFNVAGRSSPFLDAGIAHAVGEQRLAWTFSTEPRYAGPRKSLGDVLIGEHEVPEKYFVTEKELERYRYYKGAKSVERKSRATGHVYRYVEGAVSFPEPLDRPSRTLVTAEGERYPSRFKHVVLTPSGRYRRLVPLELERLNMFPDDHTEGVTDVQRAFLMGNALVIGVVERIGRSLAESMERHVERRRVSSAMFRQRSVGEPGASEQLG